MEHDPTTAPNGSEGASSAPAALRLEMLTSLRLELGRVFRCEADAEAQPETQAYLHDVADACRRRVHFEAEERVTGAILAGLTLRIDDATVGPYRTAVGPVQYACFAYPRNEPAGIVRAMTPRPEEAARAFLEEVYAEEALALASERLREQLQPRPPAPAQAEGSAQEIGACPSCALAGCLGFTIGEGGEVEACPGAVRLAALRAARFLRAYPPATPCPCGDPLCHGFDVFNEQEVQRNDECAKYGSDAEAWVAARALMRRHHRPEQASMPGV